MSQSQESPEKELTDIFINYRRADTAGHAGRLEQDLSRRFPGRVFMDIHAIEVGADFDDAINEQLAKCGALIVMIGNQWLSITDHQTGKRRLEDPEDLVALEIAEALKRKIRVIPVLVEDASMPQAEELPASLAALSRRNAMEISDTRWDYDVAQLVKVLEKVCGIPAPPATAIAGTGTGTGTGKAIRTGTGDGATTTSRILKFGLPVAAALAVVVGLVLYFSQGRTTDGGHASPSPSPSTSPPPGTPTPTPLAHKESEPKALVRLSKQPEPEAEFLFPFDTGGRWQWNLKESSAGKPEYFWDVRVGGKLPAPGYYISYGVYKSGKNGDTRKSGDFSELVDDAEGYVHKPRGQRGTFEYQKEFVKFTHQVQPDGLKVIIQGANVEKIFADRPATVVLRTLLRKGEVSRVVNVQYSRN